MAATRQDIEGWFDCGVNRGSWHMLVVCDTFDHDDYPVFTYSDQECLARYKYPGNMQRVMEVYDLRSDKAEQMNERRALRLPVIPNETSENEMGLREQIMNINYVPENMDAEPNQRLAYKTGHRDARHAAAELVLKADVVMDAARAVLAFRVDTTTRGDIRDNDASRMAIKTLADAVADAGVP